MMKVLQKSFYIDHSSRRLAASLVMPEDGARGAMIVAMPLVEERKSLMLPIMEAARLFAAENGLAVLRFDWAGTGDSAGDFADFAPSDWAEDLSVAAEWLSNAFSALPVVALGIRSGALLLSDSTSPVLMKAAKAYWDPVGGVEGVRQWMQRHLVNDMVAYGHARASRAAMESDLAAGKPVDLDGFEFTGRHMAGLAAFRLARTESPTLVICTGRPSAAAVQAFGADSITQLRLPPYWNGVGYIDTAALRSATSQWIRDSLASGWTFGRSCAGIALEGEATVHCPWGCERLVEIPSDGGQLGDSGACFSRGVLALPASGSIKRTVLFLSGWSGDRQGPHRLFVQCARRLAEEGVASLRLDYRGRGEGDGAHDSAGIATMADDAVAAARWLVDSGYAPNGLDVIAICSGCKVAITLASRVDIRHVDLLSAEAMGSIRARSTNARKTFSALMAYARKLFKAETWRKIIKGEVRTDMVGKAISRHETRSADEVVAEDATLSRFRKYRGYIHFVYGGSDPESPGASAAYRRFCKKNGIKAHFDLIPNAGHSYYSVDWTRQLFERLGI